MRRTVLAVALLRPRRGCVLDTAIAEVGYVGEVATVGAVVIVEPMQAETVGNDRQSYDLVTRNLHGISHADLVYVFDQNPLRRIGGQIVHSQTIYIARRFSRQS